MSPDNFFPDQPFDPKPL